jgi:Ca2+-binding EF-hand superfamily protein
MSTGEFIKMTKEAREIFDSYDSNNDGKIEKSELKLILNNISKKLGLPFPTDNDINKGFKQLDKNNNNLLEFDEFIVFYKQVYDQLH